ncbi:hypothetical protein RFI_05838 [Reticulomyxa filosa]|uniref:AAA+ ATPase domain-containing protein n=1 Tax=Reticulomyxa filosa TaxID=46433 RepID=X6NY82_RETFI|nr:hypothetical protein RFI_05838 [Reticulomyxa filosa]|eukprot:ETO31280.1 hypothetical protein RFI_05838 [Reticulomyxa filosa]
MRMKRNQVLNFFVLINRKVYSTHSWSVRTKLVLLCIKVQLEMPWLEKYRPRVLKDVVGNEETISRLKVIAKNGNMPNLLISGPPGTGKTTSIHCLAFELLGQHYKQGVLELNASDDRGIDVVRNKIKMFAQQKITLPPGRHKIIILDEADRQMQFKKILIYTISMTPAAQQALRRTMELYSNTTRFALACNISSKIIEPVQSRCAILRYTRLTDQQILQRILEILKEENVQSYTNGGLEALLFVSDGDMRNGINGLQATYAGFKTITAENVYKVCDVPHPKAMATILDHCKDGDVINAINCVQHLLAQGHSTLDFISTLFRVTKTHKMDDNLRLKWIRVLFLFVVLGFFLIKAHNGTLQEMGFIHARIADGLDSPLQLTGLIGKMCLAKEGKLQDA